MDPDIAKEDFAAWDLEGIKVYSAEEHSVVDMETDLEVERKDLAATDSEKIQKLLVKKTKPLGLAVF